MSGATLHIDIAGLAPLQRFADRLAGISATDLVQGVVSLVESQTRRRISTEKTDPTGDAWLSLTDDYAQRKAKKSSGGLLEFHGGLLDSIGSDVVGDSGSVGTNIIYGATHQFGDADRGIWPRKYIGISRENDREIDAVVDDWVQGVLNG